MMENIGYLDLHSHILPGIDDGSKDWDMTEGMLRAAYRQGVRTIVATPHNYQEDVKQDNGRIRDLCRRAEELAQMIDSSFHVLPGNEVLYRAGIPAEVEAGHVLTLGDSAYLLVEFFPSESYTRISQGLRELLGYGYYPVIAHMERVGALFGNEKRISEVVEMGCYLQVNCQSLMGGFFDRQSSILRKLIQNRKIHFLGSDCHNLSGRPPIMEDCVKRLYQKLPKDCVERLLYGNQEQFLRKKCI